MLNVLVVTPIRVLFEGRAESVIFPGEEGVFEVLSYHKPLLSRLISGSLIIDHEHIFPIRRGVAGVNRNKATVIVEE